MAARKEEVDWHSYFASIVSVCPWSKAYWHQQKIEVCDWQGEHTIKPLGRTVARMYLHRRASARQLKKFMKRFNCERPKEEWLYSHPRFGGHSTPVGVLIQQDHALLTKIRKQNDKKDTKRLP